MIAVPTHVFLGRDEKRFEIKMFRNDLLLGFVFFSLSWLFTLSQAWGPRTGSHAERPVLSLRQGCWEFLRLKQTALPRAALGSAGALQRALGKVGRYLSVWMSSGSVWTGTFYCDSSHPGEADCKASLLFQFALPALGSKCLVVLGTILTPTCLLPLILLPASGASVLPGNCLQVSCWILWEAASLG